MCVHNGEINDDEDSTVLRRTDDDFIGSAENDDNLSIFSFHDDDDSITNIDYFSLSDDTHSNNKQHIQSVMKIGISFMSWFSIFLLYLKNGWHLMNNLPRKLLKHSMRYHLMQHQLNQEIIDEDIGIGIHNMEAWDKDLFVVNLIQNEACHYIANNNSKADSSEDSTSIDEDEAIDPNHGLTCNFSS